MTLGGVEVSGQRRRPRCKTKQSPERDEAVQAWLLMIPSKCLKGFDVFSEAESTSPSSLSTMAFLITAHDSHWTVLSFDTQPATLPSAKDIQFIL